MPVYDNYPNYRSGPSVKYIYIYLYIHLYIFRITSIYILNYLYIYFFSFASCPTKKLTRLQRQIDKVLFCLNFIYSHNLYTESLRRDVSQFCYLINKQ